MPDVIFLSNAVPWGWESCSSCALPAAGLHELRFFDAGGGQALHCASDGLAGFGDDLGVVEVGGGDDDGACAGDGFFTLFRRVFDVERSGAFFHEDSGANEDSFGAEL